MKVVADFVSTNSNKARLNFIVGGVKLVNIVFSQKRMLLLEPSPEVLPKWITPTNNVFPRPAL